MLAWALVDFGFQQRQRLLPLLTIPLICHLLHLSMLLVDEVNCAVYLHHDHVGQCTHEVLIEGENRKL